MNICRKCVEYGWNPQREALPNQETCLFHADIENKGASVKDFNSSIFKLISTAKSKELTTNTTKACNLRGTIFPGDIYFVGYNDENPFPYTILNSCIFHGRAYFCDVCFASPVFFAGAQFKRSVNFYNSRFLSEASFNEAKFESSAYFGHAVFQADVSFLSAEFSGKANFTIAEFYGKALFGWVSCSSDGLIHMEAIDQKSLQNIEISSAEVRSISFYNCDWPQRLNLDRTGFGEILNLRACSGLYRAMKQRAAEAHDQPQVSHWHFREKLMQLKQLLLSANSNALIEAVEDTDLCKRTRARAWWELFRALPWRLRRSLPFLYWTSSGFGERPTRGAACCFALVLLPLIILTPLKLIETGWSLTPDNQRIAEVLLEWVRCMPFAKLDAPAPNPPTILSALRTMLSYGFQLVISLQAALFALAVCNRFRR